MWPFHKRNHESEDDPKTTEDVALRRFHAEVLNPSSAPTFNSGVPGGDVRGARIVGSLGGSEDLPPAAYGTPNGFAVRPGQRNGGQSIAPEGAASVEHLGHDNHHNQYDERIYASGVRELVVTHSRFGIKHSEIISYGDHETGKASITDFSIHKEGKRTEVEVKQGVHGQLWHSPLAAPGNSVAHVRAGHDGSLQYFYQGGQHEVFEVDGSKAWVQDRSISGRQMPAVAPGDWYVPPEKLGQYATTPPIYERQTADGHIASYRWDNNGYSSLESYAMRDKSGNLTEFGLRPYGAGPWTVWHGNNGTPLMAANEARHVQDSQLQDLINSARNPNNRNNIDQFAAKIFHGAVEQKNVEVKIKPNGEHVVIAMSQQGERTTAFEDGTVLHQHKNGCESITQRLPNGGERLVESEAFLGKQEKTRFIFKYNPSQQDQIVAVTRLASDGHPPIIDEYDARANKWHETQGDQQKDVEFTAKAYPNGEGGSAPFVDTFFKTKDEKEVVLRLFTNGGQMTRELYFNSNKRTLFPTQVITADGQVTEIQRDIHGNATEVNHIGGKNSLLVKRSDVSTAWVTQHMLANGRVQTEPWKFDADPHITPNGDISWTYKVGQNTSDAQVTINYERAGEEIQQQPQPPLQEAAHGYRSAANGGWPPYPAAGRIPQPGQMPPQYYAYAQNQYPYASQYSYPYSYGGAPNYWSVPVSSPYLHPNFIAPSVSIFGLWQARRARAVNSGMTGMGVDDTVAPSNYS